MGDIVKSFSKYRLFETLFPGALFLVMFYYLISNFDTSNSIALLIIAYFSGLIISRISSLLTSKLLYKFTKSTGESFKNYYKAENKDSKIEDLMADKNTYRNTTTCCLMILIIKIILMIFPNLKINNVLIVILLILCILLFSAAFLKKNNDIIKRVKNISSKNKSSKC